MKNGYCRSGKGVDTWLLANFRVKSEKNPYLDYKKGIIYSSKKEGQLQITPKIYYFEPGSNFHVQGVGGDLNL